MKRLAKQDAAFVAAETPQTPMHVGGLQIFRKPKGARADYLRELTLWMRGYQPNRKPFDIVLREAPRSLARAVGPRALAWDRPGTVDMDYHVKLWALPRPATERELADMVSQLHPSLLDRTRPLWEFHLIEGLSGNRFAIYTKTHHALMDGMQARGLFAFAEDANVRGIPPIWHAGSKPKSAVQPAATSWSRYFARYGKALAQTPRSTREDA